MNDTDVCFELDIIFTNQYSKTASMPSMDDYKVKEIHILIYSNCSFTVHKVTETVGRSKIFASSLNW